MNLCDEDGIDGPFEREIAKVPGQPRAKRVTNADLAAALKRDVKQRMRECAVLSRERSDRDHGYRAFALGWIGAEVRPISGVPRKPSKSVAEIRLVIEALDELCAEPFEGKP